ncbi:MAG: PAS domain S-box protein [Aulosira sp. ZfuVER01]|nr:PAS domain S-box protein [Aulosira sp. ZfuVER01]MDZ7999093.1 PAS domain S-box protein [Aulosira sp. DedVER01a]MDZ8051183.1 PAS domain S-box protein [Aulosira sp. ZfuCHP01]
MESLSQVVQQNEIMLHWLNDLADQGILITDTELKIRSWNHWLEIHTGLSSIEIIGRNLLEVYPELTQRRLDRFYHQALNGQVVVLSQRLHGYLLPIPSRIDNGISPYMLQSVRIAPLIENGCCIGTTTVIGDVTERVIQEAELQHQIEVLKRAEEQLQEQAALLNIATDAIIVQDLKNQIVFWNKSAEQLYGWTAEEALGKQANQLLYQTTSPQLKDALLNITQKQEWQGELRQVTKDGREVIVESRWTIVPDSQKNPKSILVVNTDITQKKQLEAQFLRIQRMDSIGTLAGGIAHDLNNLLTPILTAAQLLQKQVYPDNKHQHLLSMIETSAKRGANLVKQVLSFARGIEGKHTAILVGDLISEIRQIVQATFPKPIQVYIGEIPKNLLPISGDFTQLSQVFMNLCVNARDAMPDGGILTICAENIFIDENYARMNIEAKIGFHVAITISDTGSGISPTIIDRIFEPFFTSKEFGQGAGLGLSTAIGIVKSHGGFVNVRSEVGKGTEFKVFLPAAPEFQTPPLDDLDLVKGHRELILVVDDETSILETTKISLEANNYRVLIAHDGIQAIALYAQHQHKISIVLMDMMMPSIDGLTTIRTLQKINPQVKIIASSGFASSSMKAEVTNQGIKTFLSKPYTMQELLSSISGVLSCQG